MDESLTTIGHIPENVIKWGNCLLLHTKTPIWDEEYQRKLAIAKKAYKHINELFELHSLCSPYEIDFCWDDYIIVGGEGFGYVEMTEDG